MRRLVCVLVAMLLAVAPVLAVGTVTVATTTVLGNVDRYTITWVSSAGGAVSGNAFTPRGYLLEVKFVPATGGTQPSDQYDVTLVDGDGVDVLTQGGTSHGANLSNASASRVLFTTPVPLDGSTTLDLVVANAGNAKGGTVVILVRRS